MTTSHAARPRRVRQPVGAVAVAILALLLWLAWLGWDRQQDTDPVTGNTTGPYQAWQVIGCGLCLLALIVVAVRAGVHPLLAAAALTLSFTAAWTVSAAAQDDSGLFLVGAVLLFVGLAAGSAVAAYVTRALSRA